MKYVLHLCSLLPISLTVDPGLLPKIELHLHLDCSLSYAVASRLRPGLTPAEFERDFIAPAQCPDLADYLTRARHGVALMQTEEALRLVVTDLFEQLVADRVLYAEIRFAPHLHCEKGMAPEQVVEIIDEQVRRESARTGIEARVILCTLRHFSAAESNATAELARRFRGSSVVALDIAGDEAGFPLEAHIDAFQAAKADGIHRTAHAGEARGAKSVRETLEALAPSRIGHGVRSVEDPDLVGLLKRSRIHLEICPTSNVQTNIIPDARAHPVGRLYASGVSVGINTDARTISNVTLRSEYALLEREFGWGVPEFRQCNLNAIEAAFAPEKLRRELASRLTDEYARL